MSSYEEADARERVLRLLWSEAARPARGPRRGLTMDAIVAAAITVAENEGLPALSMRRVAAELGVGTASLYTYLPGKAELAALMLDALAAEDTLPHEYPGDWRAKLEAWARADWAAFLEHPWILELSTIAAAPGPGLMRWLDSALRVLEGTGLSEDGKLAVIESIDGYVRGLAALHHRGGGDEDSEQRDAVLRELVDWSRYPALVRALESGARPYAVDRFEFGLQRLLDGVEALIEREK